MLSVLLSEKWICLFVMFSIILGWVTIYFYYLTDYKLILKDYLKINGKPVKKRKDNFISLFYVYLHLSFLFFNFYT